MTPRPKPHRIAAEAKLGRPLRAGETVHHRNRNRADNSWANLRVFPSRGAHTRHHWRRRSVHLLFRYVEFIATVRGVEVDEAFAIAMPHWAISDMSQPPVHLAGKVAA